MTSISSDNAFLRNDTIFGTCELIGGEFGFNPNWLRIPLAASVLISPTGAIGAYIALSLVVLAARLLFPAKANVATAEPAVAEGRAIEANDDQRELIAA